MGGRRAGYSGKPLAQKLGIRSGMTVAVLQPPERYRELLGAVPDVTFTDSSERDPLHDAPPLDVIHWFVRERRMLEAGLADLRRRIRPNGMIWVSWPKKASKVETDVTEDVVRGIALGTGLVDVKVCAVDDVWSGLKLVIRKSERR